MDRIEEIRERLANHYDAYIFARSDIACLLSQLERAKELLENLLKHCDLAPEGETKFERDVIAARAFLNQK